MQAIADHCPKIQSLNLSGNPLPKKDTKHSQGFLDNLLKLIEGEAT
jgi:hypothetical protein